MLAVHMRRPDRSFSTMFDVDVMRRIMLGLLMLHSV